MLMKAVRRWIHPRKRVTRLVVIGCVAAVLLVLGAGIDYSPSSELVVQTLEADDLPVEATRSMINVTFIEAENSTSSNQSSHPHQVIRMLSWTAQTMFTKEGEDEQWFSAFGKSPMDICYNEEFKYLDPEMNCTYTNDKSLYNKSDVILFRGRRLDNIALPIYRQPNQSWLFFDFEPPFKIWQRTNISKYNGIFNLTSTYSKDSDIPYTYYRSKLCVQNNTKYAELAGMDYTIKKTRNVLVGWMVSVCKTQSKRERYVKELQRHIDVDIYGGCGPLSCGSNNLSTWNTDNCDQLLFHGNNSYKFYLAFENSLCEDYISEKLWRMMQLDVVPVVMGGVDYANILPKGSYIDTRDFKSPRYLAAHLKYLDKHVDKYNQYLRIKNSLHCFNTVPYMPKQCNLCKGLHQLEPKNDRVVHDLASFLSTRQCTQPRLFFKMKAKDDFFS